MTPKERAKEATWEAGCPDWTTDDREELETAVERAIIAAVEEEREACAQIAAKYFDAGEIVDEIRARK